MQKLFFFANVNSYTLGSMIPVSMWLLKKLIVTQNNYKVHLFPYYSVVSIALTVDFSLINMSINEALQRILPRKLASSLTGTVWCCSV